MATLKNNVKKSKGFRLSLYTMMVKTLRVLLLLILFYGNVKKNSF